MLGNGFRAFVVGLASVVFIGGVLLGLVYVPWLILGLTAAFYVLFITMIVYRFSL